MSSNQGPLGFPHDSTVTIICRGIKRRYSIGFSTSDIEVIKNCFCLNSDLNSDLNKYTKNVTEIIIIKANQCIFNHFRMASVNLSVFVQFLLTNNKFKCDSMSDCISHATVRLR